MSPRFAFTLCVIIAAGCSEQHPPSASSLNAVDLILHNGTILTLNENDDVGTTIVVLGDRIVAVGGENLLGVYQADKIVDLSGKTVMPGFIDSHTHIRGNPAHYIDLTTVSSLAEIRTLVTEKAAELEPGSWITGYGWSEDELAEGRRPSRDDLDRAAPDNPVILTRAGGHSAVCSSTAFMIAGIDANTTDPERGIIERDANGELNGIIRERQDLVGRLVPPSSPEALRPSLVANLKDLFRHGITSIVQAADRVDHFMEWQIIYDKHRGQLPRASVQLAYEGREKMAASGLVTGVGDEHLKVGAIKIFADGGFTGPAAYTNRPYKGEDTYRGTLNMTPNELQQLIEDAHANGWQLGIHAIGDAAIELTVEYLVMAIDAYPRDDHRHYLNHFTVMPNSSTMSVMAEYGIGITQQPNFTYTLEGRYVANLEGDRLETNNPLRTPMDHGIHVAISSDILPIGPTVGLYGAVTRKGRSGRVFGADERLTMTEALKGYTIKGAYLSREESTKGTLERGKLADMIVLDANPLEMDPEAVLTLEVYQTYLGGRLVYSTGTG